MQRKEPRVLFFTTGGALTDEDRKLADKIGYNIGFRNAAMMDTRAHPEAADAVAGAAPNNYREKYPHVSSAAELTEKLRLRDRGQLQLPRFGKDGTEVGDATEETSTISAAELNQLSGEGVGGEGDGDNFDVAKFLEDKSEDFKRGFAEAAGEGFKVPDGVNDEYKAGVAAYGEHFGDDEDEEPVSTGNAPQAARPGRRSRKAAAAPAAPANAPTPPPQAPTWNQN